MKRKFIRSGILLLCLLLPFMNWRLLLMHDVNSRLAAIRSAGLPTNSKELDVWYPAVRDAENAALVMTQAFALCGAKIGSKVVWDFKLPPAGQSLPPDQTDLLNKDLERELAALAMVDEALSLRESRYPIDLSMGANTPLPHLAYLKRLATFKQFQAVLAMQRGKGEYASTNIVTILRLAGTLEKEPLLISQLLRLAIIRSAVATLERRLNSGSMGDAERTGLLNDFSRTAAGATNLIARALIGERAMFLSYFCMSKAEAARMLPPAENSDQEKQFPRHQSFVLRIAGFYDWDRGFFLHSMEQILKNVSLEPPENLRVDRYLARAGEAARKQYRTVSATTFSSYAGIVARYVETEALLRLAMTSLSVEQFRNARGRLPETLNDLRPEFLALPPTDPFDAELLRYRQMDKGYVIYSVGRDLEENGGKEKPEGKQYVGRSGYDLSFRVRL